MSTINIDQLICLLGEKDKRAFAKALSIVENKEKGAIEILNYAYRNLSDKALIVGITGPGGAGKSTLVDKVIKHFRLKGKKVGVIAVDPSSPYTGGAFLGDRIRMSNHSTDSHVYIRSFANRGAMGGISNSTKNVLYLYKSFDFDVIIVESLGIGQDETEITNFVDVTVVTVVPGFGDSIQMAKAGMQEIADIFVINKADKPDAEEYYQQMLASLAMIPDEIRPVILKTIATNDTGVDELVEQVCIVGQKNWAKRDKKTIARVKAEIRTELIYLMEINLAKLVDFLSEKVFKGEASPFEVSQDIYEHINFKL